LQRHWRDGVFQALSLKHFAFTYVLFKNIYLLYKTFALSWSMFCIFCEWKT